MAASTVAQYLAAFPADRRAAPSAVRQVINETPVQKELSIVTPLPLDYEG